MSALEEFLLGGTAAQVESEKFAVTSKQQAEWALRMIGRHQKVIDENKDVAQGEIDRIAEWLEQENSKEERGIEYLTALLRIYHLSILEADPDAKTIKLPHGTLEVRKQQDEYTRDDETLLEWARQYAPECIKVKETVDWAMLKKSIGEVVNGKPITKDGQPIDGVTVVEREPKFAVKVGD